MGGHASMGMAAASVSLVLALAASTLFVFLPSTTSGRVTSAGSAGSPSSPAVTHETLLEREGSSVLVVLAIPVLVAALGVAVGAGSAPGLGRTFAAFLLCAFSFLGAASVGLFYLPAALAMVLAAFASPFRGAVTTK